MECLARPVLVPVETDSAVFYSWLKTSPDAVLFEWPVTVPWRLWDMVDVRYMYRSTLHWRPLLNGYSGFYPSSYLSLLNHMRGFPDTATIAELQRRGATVIVVHEVQHSRPSYGDAVARLMRDPSVRVMAEEKEGRQPRGLLQAAPAARRERQLSVFRDRATARPTITSPHVSSAAICGHSTLHPIPFRKIPRTMTMK